MLEQSLSWWQQDPNIAISSAIIYQFRGLLRQVVQDRGIQHNTLGSRHPGAQALLSFRKWSSRLRARQRGAEPHLLDVKSEASSQCSVVFTDGSFSLEAPGVGFAGCGVYIPSQPDLSLSVPLPGEIQTNNRAELYALYLGIKVFPPEAPVVFYSDSRFVVNGVTSWLKRWKGVGFKGSSGHAVAHSDLWILVDKALGQRVGAWAIRWAPGHIGIQGNEQADRLANAGRLAHPQRLAFLTRASLPPNNRVAIL